MGNVGGIEKILVGCILVIILAILGIAVGSTNDPIEPAYQKVASMPDREHAQDPANRSKKKEGSPSLIAGAQDVGAGNETGPATPGTPRRVNGTANQANGELTPKAPVDVTDQSDPPSPPVKPPVEPVKQKTEPEQPKTTGLPKFHVVVKGDSIEKIAVQYYDDRRMADEILKLNEELEPTKLKEGQKVLLPAADIKALLKDDDVTESPFGKKTPAKVEEPAPKTTNGKYRVKKGDTILSICRDHYGSVERWQEVLKANGMKEGKDLREGMDLTLP